MTSTAIKRQDLSVAQGVPNAAADEATGLRLSFSRVDTYRSCPLKFRFAYVDELPSQPGPHLSWGSSIHAALEAWWDQKLPQPPPVETLLQTLYDRWDDEGFAGMARDEKVTWYRHAQDVLRRHHARYAPVYVPAVATEQWFELDLGDDVTVVGSIDHVQRTPSGGLGIVDWKTNRKAKTRHQVAGNLQLAIYTLAAAQLWGTEPDWVALDFVVPGLRVQVNRADIDTAKALADIREVAEAIRAERFDPTPTALCPWCDWRDACPVFQGEGPDVTSVAVTELQRLRRRSQRDQARIAQLERLVRDRLGEDATVEIAG
ncbi:MAG: PD-(D/E)XK nuclease family protein [Actinomycetota bacterium]|jgi:DNA helicase-2/ATP-dependent DNA helicase PcrA|nr:PD-(D/E)XK nuclease family protein [Actinomycetota bacterium]